MVVQFLRRRPVAVACVAVAALCAGALSRSAIAFNPQPDPPFLGMLGLADGQTMRINLVNLATIDPNGVPPDPCRGRLSIFDADGNELAGRHVNVPAGHATFLDFAADFSTNGAGITATPLRAEVLPAVSSDAGLLPPGPCRISVEIFDTATGRTQIAVLPPDPCRGAHCLAAAP
ncbi:MAG TPA: hypothetical protein VGG73_03470 [Vicinamibacterales bacterium]|jgi:hypothetical protein